MAKGKYQRWLEPDGLILLQGWARDGLTEEQIAQNMGINRKTLWEWKTQHPPIGNALKSGADVADYQVENALYKAALDGNITAMIFWLKNRKPKKWKDKPVDDADEEQLQKLQKLLGGIPSAF